GAEVMLFEKLARRSRWYMSSVVAMELRAGCRTAIEARLLRKLLDSFEGTQRVISPDHRAWVRAGEILADLGQRTQLERTRRQTIVHDVLIALSSVRIGACVVTANAGDFGAIARVLPLIWFGSLEEALVEIG